ncbi:hypothetical protein Efla_005883 [Eimeria flavescens]
MSVSSLGAAAGPAGALSEDSVSEGGSADSLFIKDIHERRELKRQELEADGSNSGDDGEGGLLHDLLRHFRHCCASRRKGRFAPAAAAAAAPAAAANGLAAAAGAVVGARPQRARTYSASGSGSSSSSSSSSAARSSQADKYMPDKAQLVAWRVVMGQGGPGGRRQDGEGLLGLGAPGLPWSPTTLTANQAAWAACSWCVKLENNEKMTGRLISDIVSAAETQKAAVDVLHAVKETTQFGTIEFVRRIDGQEPEDVLGDFNSLYEGELKAHQRAATGAAVYAVLQAARVVAMFVRQHGELTEVAAFNIMPTEKERFPPSVLGFNSLEDMQDYVLELFKRDPRTQSRAREIRLLCIQRGLAQLEALREKGIAVAEGIRQGAYGARRLTAAAAATGSKKLCSSDSSEASLEQQTDGPPSALRADWGPPAEAEAARDRERQQVAEGRRLRSSAQRERKPQTMLLLLHAAKGGGGGKGVRCSRVYVHCLAAASGQAAAAAAS